MRSRRGGERDTIERERYEDRQRQRETAGGEEYIQRTLLAVSGDINFIKIIMIV